MLNPRERRILLGAAFYLILVIIGIAYLARHFASGFAHGR
jgi:type II secretory pathway component PulM